MTFRVLTIALLFIQSAVARESVFDVHVHLRDGEASLKAYEADVVAAKIELTGFGAMWFGGPHQALQGEPAKVRASGLTSDETGKILSGNARKLFGK